MPFFLWYVHALPTKQIPMYTNQRFKEEESKTKRLITDFILSQVYRTVHGLS